MNNPGMDLEIWKKLRKKWTKLDAQGHKLRVDFKLIADPSDKNKILLIDVIQQIDRELITETVQRRRGEAYPALGIDGLSIERLVTAYKDTIKRLQSEIKQRDKDLIITMSPTSPTSGEVRAYLAKPDVPAKDNIQVNYRHYYILNALRDKMLEQWGESWSKVRVVYHAGNLEFYFEYF